MCSPWERDVRVCLMLESSYKVSNFWGNRKDAEFGSEPSPTRTNQPGAENKEKQSYDFDEIQSRANQSQSFVVQISCFIVNQCRCLLLRSRVQIEDCSIAVVSYLYWDHVNMRAFDSLAADISNYKSIQVKCKTYEHILQMTQSIQPRRRNCRVGKRFPKTNNNHSENDSPIYPSKLGSLSGDISIISIISLDCPEYMVMLFY
jgi:hypothetical protein